MSRPPVSAPALLRDIQHATQRMKKARKLLTELRGGTTNESQWSKAADAAIESVKSAAGIVAAVPLELADSELLLKIVQMQRFSTNLLVKARRVKTALGREDGLRELAGNGMETDSDDWSDDE